MRRMNRLAQAAAVLALALCISAGCDRGSRGARVEEQRSMHPASQSPGKTGGDAQQDMPAPETPTTTDASPVQPRTDRPAAEPARAETPPEPEKKLPEHLTLMQRVDPNAEGRIEVSVSGSDVLELAAHNVKRFRVSRERSPLATTRSVVLRVDGQVFEWTRAYTTIELES